MATAARPGRGLRAVLAVGLVLALAAGLWVRSLFKGAALQDSVEASSVTPAPLPAAEPSFTPPVLSYPPAVGYSGGVPSSMAALTIQASPLPYATIPTAAPPPVESVAPVTGMTSVAPPSEPTRKTAFTDDDLVRGRTQAPVTSTATPTGTPAGVIADSVAPRRPTEGVSEDDVRKWTAARCDRRCGRAPPSHVRRLGRRRAQVDVTPARPRGRRAGGAVEGPTARGGGGGEASAGEAAASDPDARDKAQREVGDALEDLEKAERKLSEKQRDLDEAKAEARSAGLRFEN